MKVDGLSVCGTVFKRCCIDLRVFACVCVLTRTAMMEDESDILQVGWNLMDGLGGKL